MTDLAVRARGRLAAEGMPVTEWANGPGDRYRSHAHTYDKVLLVVEGSIVFRSTSLGVAHALRAGDRLDLPAGTIHAADVGPEGVRCLEGHLAAGSLGQEPRRMADWMAVVSERSGPQTSVDGET